MRLSDAGLRCQPTKPIYPDHRSPPWLTGDAPRDRSNRLLDDTQRNRDRAHRRCDSLQLLQHPYPDHSRTLSLDFTATGVPAETRIESERSRVDIRMPRRLRATASPNEVVLIRPTKWASSGATSTRIPRIQRRARRSIITFESSPRSCRLTMRLSDAGLRRRPTKLVYLNHRLPPCPTESAAPRSLEPIVRPHGNDTGKAGRSLPLNLRKYGKEHRRSGRGSCMQWRTYRERDRAD